MNHTNLAIAVVTLAIIATLIGAVRIGSIQQQTAAAQKDDEGDTSITNFVFKQKLKNNCSGFALCTNDADETLGTPPSDFIGLPIPIPTP
jgi:hypothetical protein